MVSSFFLLLAQSSKWWPQSAFVSLPRVVTRRSGRPLRRVDERLLNVRSTSMKNIVPVKFFVSMFLMLLCSTGQHSEMWRRPSMGGTVLYVFHLLISDGAGREREPC